MTFFILNLIFSQNENKNQINDHHLNFHWSEKRSCRRVEQTREVSRKQHQQKKEIQTNKKMFKIKLWEMKMLRKFWGFIVVDVDSNLLIVSIKNENKKNQFFTTSYFTIHSIQERGFYTFFLFIHSTLFTTFRIWLDSVKTSWWMV